MPPKQKAKISKQSNKLKSKTLEKSRRKKSKSLVEDKPTKKGRPPKDSSRKTKKKVAHTKGFKKELNSRKAVLTALGRARETLEERLERQAEDENNHLLEDQQSESNEQGKLGRSSEGVTYAGSWKVENHDERKQSKRSDQPEGLSSLLSSSLMSSFGVFVKSLFFFFCFVFWVFFIKHFVLSHT